MHNVHRSWFGEGPLIICVNSMWIRWHKYVVSSRTWKCQLIITLQWPSTQFNALIFDLPIMLVFALTLVWIKECIYRAINHSTLICTEQSLNAPTFMHTHCLTVPSSDKRANFIMYGVCFLSTFFPYLNKCKHVKKIQLKIIHILLKYLVFY